MAGATHEDGFHEIQLNGKQLVFLFMAVTVVSVVIFLCGVLVGRGVRLDRGGPETLEAAAAELPEPPPPVEASGNSSAPVAPDEKTSFNERLESSAPPREKLQPVDAPPPAKAEAVAEAPAAAPPVPAPAEPKSAPSPADPKGATAPAAAGRAIEARQAPTEPAGSGIAVQVSAFRIRAEADTLANRLIAKGYSAYVVLPAPGAPALFRVRVGKFKEQREADRIAARLKKEEQFDPWIVR